ncbi:MAG TPA: mitochondrial genome maintenance protein MGM101 [Candidatus Kapabacteria bacterium]|nr:mitochondrial genome maintenance protein MGM101 [Candidatus Kapabacteria bacterium]
MTTTEMTRADELLREIEAEGVMTADAALVAPPAVQANPYVGIAAAPFSPEAAEILMGGVAEEDIEIRPDGLIYLPEIKYRRILNRAFGPGAWSLLPMEITVSPQDNMLYYKGALFVLGRFVSEAIGEQQYFPDNDRMSYATAAESAKSNCLMRCCKDLGIASELWDPTFVRGWIARNATEAWCVNVGSRDRGKKKKMWRKRESAPIDAFPWKEEGGFDAEPVMVSRPEPAHVGRREPAHGGRPEPANGNGGASRQQAYRPEARTAAVRPSAARQEEQLPLAPLVSVKQVGRFRAIARSNGWTEHEQARLLSKFGFSRAEEITRDAYDRICTALENPVILTEVRAELDEELDFGLE